ncbi:MAG: methyltransferase domain-containing protein [Caldilineaceae bacterium]
MSQAKLPDTASTTTSTGHALSEASWLDIHFEVARHENEAMVREVGFQPGWHVLDAGCGGGSFLPLISQLIGLTGKITALDLAPENIAIVEQRAAANHFACTVEAKLGSITQLPLADHSFDALWCANVVQYLTEEAFHQSAREFRRVLRPGGVLALKEMDLTAMQLGPLDPALIWRLFAALRKHNPTIWALYTLDFPRWLQQAGFTVYSNKTLLAVDRHPLTENQQALAQGGFGYLADLAATVPDLSPADRAIWQQQLGEPTSPDYIVQQPDFYWRRPYTLILARAT